MLKPVPIVGLHKDHTCYDRTAFGLTLQGSGIFYCKPPGKKELFYLPVKRRTVIKFNCKISHGFLQNSSIRTGLFWWAHNQKKGYFPGTRLSTVLEEIDKNIQGDRCLGIRVVIPELGLGKEGGIVTSISEEVCAKLLQSVSKLKTKADPSKRSNTRRIAWIGEEPAFWTKDGTMLPAEIDSKILTFTRRFLPDASIALVANSYYDCPRN